MKTLKLTLALICLLGISANAQVTVNFNVNTAPARPTVVRYYYLPDSHSYYDMTSKRYIYMTNGKWFYARHLPGKYKKYPYYKCRRVKIADYSGPRPYAYYEKHNRLYGRMGNVVYKKPAHVVVYKNKPGRGHGHGHGHGRH